ncbi:hypothetical protein CU665_18475 [Pseudomonas syringae pv. actinidifoliorum]|nr:hypothetical protein [Pseudomonas syringae pv. actinidifoliorum]
MRRSASHAVLDALRPILSVRRRSVMQSVTQRFCDVSWTLARLESPFRLSAPYFEGPKCHSDKKALSFTGGDYEQDMRLCCSTDVTQSVQNCMPRQSIGTIVS